MKNHIAILIGALALCSCEDYLTQENPNKIESEYYFTDESSLEIYTNGFIRSFATAIKSFVDGDKNADTHSWDGQAAYFMDNYSADDATNWTTSNWSQLRSINYYLDNMRNAVASDAILDHYEGVGRFFRALFYIDKVQTFGAVPWYDTSIDATDREALFKDRDNREFVASKILEDLDYACTYCLTSDKYRVRASYIHRYVALALKARFCLYEGTMRKYHAVDPSTGRAWTKDESRFYLGECVKACEAIMGDGGTTQWAPDVKFSKTGYQPIKWLTDDSSKDTNVAAIASDVPLIRYAEVLLAYAEAKAELGEMSEEVWDKTIKPLRERAGVKSIYPTAADPYMVEYFQNQVTDPFILEVRRERGIELTMENSRYQDIIRWHQGELFARPWKGVWISAVDTPLDLNADGTPETIVTANPKLQSTLNILMIDGASEAGHKLSRGTSGNILPSTALERKWQDYKYVKPIPTTARQENPNLTQNPKW